MNTVKELKMYEIIKGLTDEKRASEFIEGLQETVNSNRTDFATRQDLNELRAGTKDDLNELRKEIKDDIKQFKIDVRWAVAIMITLLLTLVVKTFFP